MSSDFTNKSNNIVKFNNLFGANLRNFITVGNSYISIVPTHGANVHAEITSVNTTSNIITLADNVWFTFANVARVTGTSGSNTINITSLTGGYDIINNGIYSNTAYPLMDIVYPGDKVLVANNTFRTVDYVDYLTGSGIIYLTSNLTTSANSLLSVNRTFTANGADVKIYTPIGQQYTNI
jgi:hypothetical protein